MIHDDVNGALLKVPVNEVGDWIDLDKRDWQILDRTYWDLAEQALDALVGLLDDPSTYARWSVGAVDHMRAQHDPVTATQALDRLYDLALI